VQRQARLFRVFNCFKSREPHLSLSLVMVR
jgi:hypothetical protein